MKMRSTAVAVGVLALLLAGCGSAEDEKASTAIASSLIDNDDSFPVTQDEADCVGDGFVEEIGVDKLQQYGLLDDDLESDSALGDTTTMSPEDAGHAADTVLACMDFEKMLEESLAEQATGSEESAACLEDALTEDVLKTFLVATFTGDETKANEALTGELVACLVGSGVGE